MTVNQVVSTMFDFDTYNHMARFLLRTMEMKTLDLTNSFQVAMEYS